MEKTESFESNEVVDDVDEEERWLKNCTFAVRKQYADHRRLTNAMKAVYLDPSKNKDLFTRVEFRVISHIKPCKYIHNKNNDNKNGSREDTFNSKAKTTVDGPFMVPTNQIPVSILEKMIAIWANRDNYSFYCKPSEIEVDTRGMSIKFVRPEAAKLDAVVCRFYHAVNTAHHALHSSDSNPPFDWPYPCQVTGLDLRSDVIKSAAHLNCTPEISITLFSFPNHPIHYDETWENFNNELEGFDIVKYIASRQSIGSGFNQQH